jgi:hypothetical protein
MWFFPMRDMARKLNASFAQAEYTCTPHEIQTKPEPLRIKAQ